MMQASKKKLVLEHLVVQAAGSKALAASDLEDIIRYGAAALFADEDTAQAPPKAEPGAAALSTSCAPQQSGFLLLMMLIQTLKYRIR